MSIRGPSIQRGGIGACPKSRRAFNPRTPTVSGGQGMSRRQLLAQRIASFPKRRYIHTNTDENGETKEKSSGALREGGAGVPPGNWLPVKEPLR